MTHPARRYTLIRSRIIAPKTLHLMFVCEDNQLITFIPGQFITLHINGSGKVLHRHYSIANAPNLENRFELVCTFVEGGLASGVLFSLEPGDSIIASGPFGLFTLKEEWPSRYVLIATGTGVAPYRSMLQEIRHRLESTHPDLEVALVFGVRHPEELLFSEEFLEFAKTQAQFQFYPCYSQEKSATLQPYERRGRVQTSFEDLKLDPQKDIIYLCGNPNMIDDVLAYLTSLGFDKKTIRREKYLFVH